MALPAAPADRHRAVAGGFGALVDGVTDWAAPSPVPTWTARDVVAHLVEWLPGFLAGGGVTLATGPSVADDPVVAWRHRTALIQDLLDGPEGRTDFTHPMLGTLPLADALDRFYTADVFMHTWDLGRASGQEVALDEEFCATLLAGMAPIEDVLRSSGQYGPAVDVPTDAPIADRLMGFIGRDPDWTP